MYRCYKWAAAAAVFLSVFLTEVAGQSCPNIISKEEWGSIGGTSSDLTTYPPTHVIVHHTETVSCTTQAECSALVRSFQQTDMNVNGWDDIGYNFLVGGDGNVYQGRGWGKLGAHTVGYNSRSIGIGIIGTYYSSLPTAQALQATKDLIACGVALGELRSDYKLDGHLQVTDTDCPGASLQNEIETWPNWDKQDCPRIITKSEWGSIGGTSQPLTTYPPTHVAIHHSESAGCTTQAECSALVRSFQNMHINQNGWTDIGYNFLVGGDGNVYEGRGWGKTGAHAPGVNSMSIGICMIGNFFTSLPNAAAMATVQQLIECGVALGEIRSDYRLIGHRQASSTDCPGDALYAEIQTWDHWVTAP